MSDLQISLLLMTTLSAAFAVLGAVLQGMRDGRPLAVALISVTLLMLVYVLLIWDSPLIVRLLPFSGAIILGNWLPLIGSFYSGVCFCATSVPRHRRAVLSCVLLCLCGYSLVSPLLGKSPVCARVEFERVLEFQTTDTTCSAACAASLLRMHQIDATEREMAELCLTREGTHWLGLYRGLKVKTAGTAWDVVVESVSGQSLMQRGSESGVLSLTFHGRAANRSFETGFQMQSGHSVICLGPGDLGTLHVFDPSPDYGFESWDWKQLDQVESAILLRLVPREGVSAAGQKIADPRRLQERNVVYWERQR